MAFPNYFKKLPNIDYAVSVNKAGQRTSLNIKDFFRFVKIKDVSLRYDSFYYTYTIKNGERPDQIAHQEYGDTRYYWMILQTNDIVDYYAQWPLSQYELDRFLLKKYGSPEGIDEIHHYETREVRDDDGRLVLEAGIKVDKDFRFEYQANPYAQIYRYAEPVEITNLKYEYRLNDAKSEIVLINKKFIGRLMSEYGRYAMSLSDSESEVVISDYYK